jgi:hypothetical protein
MKSDGTAPATVAPNAKRDLLSHGARGHEYGRFFAEFGRDTRLEGREPIPRAVLICDEIRRRGRREFAQGGLRRLREVMRERTRAMRPQTGDFVVRHRASPSERSALAAQTQIRNELAVALEVFLLQIAEEPATLADLHQEAAAAVVIFLVHAQMLGQLIDRGGENRDLHVGGAGVARAAPVGRRQLGLEFFRDGHGWVAPYAGSSRFGSRSGARSGHHRAGDRRIISEPVSHV